MKNLNLIKRLWTDSHEKQSPQRFARFAAMLIMLLTLGVGQMKAYYLYLYTGEYTGWENDYATFRVGTSGNATGDHSTYMAPHWYRMSTTKTGTQYIKRCSSGDGNTYWDGQFSASISSTNYVVKVTAYSAGSVYDQSPMYVAGDQWKNTSNADVLASWSTTDSKGKMTYDGNVTFSKTFSNVKAGNHEFKVVFYNTWTNAIGWGGTITGVNCTTANSRGNIKFTQHIAGDVTISYNASTGAITITCPKIPITLDKNSGASNGSATVDVGASSLSSITHVSRDYYDLTGYWTKSSGGYKVITAAGAFVTYSSNVSTYLNNASPATWKKTSATTLYAQWTPKTYTITYLDKGGSSYSGSNSASLPSSYTYGTGIATLTDGVKSGYRFDGWFDNSGCTGEAVTTISTTANGNKTFYAKWTENPGGTVTLTAGSGGQVSKDGSSWGASKSYSGIKTTDALNIYAQANDGYVFSSWTRTSGTGTIASTSSASTTYTPVANADAELTANFSAKTNALSVSSSTLYAGDNITLTATRTNHSLNLTYQYKIGDGSWTDIATQSGTSKTWQIPYANTYQTYKFRVKSTDGSVDIISSEQTVNVKGRIIIHVKNTNSWASLYLYSWYSSSTTTNGTWPGKTGTGLNNQSCSIHATGSQWWDVTITQETATAQKFILNCNTSGDQNQTGNLNLSSFTHDAYYAMSTNESSNQTLSTTTTPSAPTLSTSAASSIAATSATLGGNVTNLGNDIISERGYYWSTNSTLSSSNLGVGTKVTVSGTQSSTGTFSNSKTGLTNGTTYYFIAYAKNGYGTSYGAVNNFRTKFITTVTLNMQGGSDGTSEVTATEGSAMPSGKTAPGKSGYTFGGYYASAGGSGKKYYNANMTSANNWDVAASTATIHAKWTANNYTITLNDNEGSGGVGSATVTFDDDNFAFASSFVAPTRTGYIFQGYYTASSMADGDQLIDKDGNWQSDTEPYTYINEEGKWIYPNNYTLYAGWTPITYTVTYHANGGSAKDEQSDPTVTNWTYGVAQYISVASTYFDAPTKYTLFSDDSKYWNDSEHGDGTDYAWGERSNLTSTDGDNIDLYAQWYTQVTLDKNHVDASTNGSMRVRYNQHVTYQMILPTRVGYHRSGFYTTTDGGTKAFEADGTMVSGDVSGFIDDGYWIHTFASSSDPYPTFYTHWDQNHYDLTFDANDCAAYVGTATGSKASVADVAYETYVDITVGTLAREGYTFSGWSKTECATSPTYIGDSWHRISHVDGDDVTLYAVWSPNTYTISFNGQGAYYVGEASRPIRMGDNYGTRNGSTSSLPTASKSGYEFLGWYTRPNGAGTHVTDETQMTTASDHTLYAYWAKAARVYFKNTLGWESVYVTWDATWNYNSRDNGAGAKGKTQQLMSHIYGTDIWYKDIPAAILSSWKGNIAFTNISMPNYEWFDDGQAVYRRDFDSDATMFVPTPNDPNKYTKNKHDAKPGTVYYSTDMIVDKSGGDITNYRYKNGYWVRYDELQSGYTVKGSWAWDDDHYVERHSLNDSTYEFTIRNLSANSDYWFNLYKHCTTSNNYSSVFKPNADMTSASSDVVFSAQYAGGSDKKMTTTVAGDYTFKFVFSALGEIRLTIKYPLAVNDYRVVYGYTKGSAQTFASEYIKAEANAEDTISMFIHSADSATSRSLYIQKCTGITAGVPTWNTTYSAITLPSETASGKTSGVYNFRIAQNGSAAATGESIGKYDGNYYIRTDSAAGGWDFYKEYPSSQMTFSEYSLSQTLSAPYSHYYCQYVGNSSTDISYTIATDYSPAICPVLEGDATIGVGNKTLPSGKPASVRFTYNEETNGTFRSYLKSAQGDGNKRFLVLHGSDNKVLDAGGNTIAGEGEGAEQMHANELLFSDTENWVYELAFKAKPGAKVSIIARYNDVDRYLVGKADAWETIISGGADTKYDIAAVYDFKTNRLITTWIPSGTISDQIEEVDVLIERHNQDGATTITFGRAAVEEEAGSISAKRVIGALRFDYNELVGRVASWTPDTRAKMMFFISFPFDVNVSDIFGLNTNYGEAFIVQGYNGAKRAEKGFFKGDGTDTFWETLPVDTVMHAGVGYVVTLDNDYFNGDVGHIWDNKRAGDHVYMYFPSANDPEHPVIINSDAKTINVPAHLCTINRTFNSGKLNHKYTDSNWNLMGVPIFQNHTGDDGIAGTPGALFTEDEEPSDTTEYADPKNPAFGYFYVWNTDKTYTIQSAVGFEFKPMHSYMVQYAGNVKFTCAEPVVPSLAPRRTAMKENYNIELQVLNNSGDMLNHTYVELRENAVDSFALNEDIYMMSSNKAVSVYTFAGTYDVAANVLSIGSHVVPVGVIVKQAGTYTFTMPSNFSGTVTLVDTYAQTRTNLNIEDYEVSLPKGTDEERFYLEININKVPTAIDGAKAGEGSFKDGKAHKFIENDMMYILKDGVLYDARGNRVK